jgi:MarR family transcriptional regulator, transcriptional regulator for hemolysin
MRAVDKAPVSHSPGPPAAEPIGLHLARVAKEVSRAFDAVLVGAGGSLPMWVVLVSLQAGPRRAQRDLAAAIGIEGATLTYHLNRMEADGLIGRRRDPANRRVHVVELTEAGRQRFADLLGVVTEFDRRLRDGFSAAEIAVLGEQLERLRRNIEPLAAEPAT